MPAQIQLSNGEVSTVSRRDVPRLSAFKWWAHKIHDTWYAVTDYRGKRIYMHRLIKGVRSRRVLVDHRDGNGLNNVRSNLRRASHRQNLRAYNHKSHKATSRYRGVSFRRDVSKWRAYIWSRNRYVCLGLFGKEKDAARAYDRAAKRLFGRFCHLNFS